MTAATFESSAAGASRTDVDRPPVSGVGRISALLLALALVSLKLMQLGEQLGWQYAADYPFVRGIEWAEQWLAIAIIVLEGIAGAAAISIAFSIFISNTFTTNISSKIVRKVTNAVNEETKNNIASIRKDVAEFRELLEARQANPDDLRLLNEFLKYARDKQIEDLDRTLKGEGQVINRIIGILSTAVQELRNARAGGSPPAAGATP